MVEGNNQQNQKSLQTFQKSQQFRKPNYSGALSRNIRQNTHSFNQSKFNKVPNKMLQKKVNCNNWVSNQEHNFNKKVFAPVNQIDLKLRLILIELAIMVLELNPTKNKTKQLIKNATKHWASGKAGGKESGLMNRLDKALFSSKRSAASTTPKPENLWQRLKVAKETIYKKEQYSILTNKKDQLSQEFFKSEEGQQFDYILNTIIDYSSGSVAIGRKNNSDLVTLRFTEGTFSQFYQNPLCLPVYSNSWMSLKTLDYNHKTHQPAKIKLERKKWQTVESWGRDYWKNVVLELKGSEFNYLFAPINTIGNPLHVGNIGTDQPPLGELQEMGPTGVTGMSIPRLKPIKKVNKLEIVPEATRVFSLCLRECQILQPIAEIVLKFCQFQNQEKGPVFEITDNNKLMVHPSQSTYPHQLEHLDHNSNARKNLKRKYSNLIDPNRNPCKNYKKNEKEQKTVIKHISLHIDNTNEGSKSSITSTLSGLSISTEKNQEKNQESVSDLETYEILTQPEPGYSNSLTDTSTDTKPETCVIL
jgi:hypothetical protein